MGVDSHQFPARNYGDLAFRTWGTAARHIVNVLQAVALLLLLGQVTILFGQNISEISLYKICYIVCPLIFVVLGFSLTQIRTLKSYGWIANFGFWFNILAMFISMGATAHNPPNVSISTLGSVGSRSFTFTPIIMLNNPLQAQSIRHQLHQMVLGTILRLLHFLVCRQVVLQDQSMVYFRGFLPLLGCNFLLNSWLRCDVLMIF